MKFLLLSGPPGAGKDTVGMLLSMMHDFPVEKFAAPLMTAAQAFGFSMNEADKEKPTGPRGLSRRQFQIELSEHFAKPLMGNDIFGRALALRARGMPGLVVVTDSGFRGEAMALVEEIGTDNVRRLHIHRPGYDYSRDSRSDWDATGTGILRLDVVNDAPVDELKRKLVEVLAPWKEWLTT